MELGRTFEAGAYRDVEFAMMATRAIGGFDEKGT